MNLKLYLIICLVSNLIFAQSKLTGIVKEQVNEQFSKPLLGANIIWEGTSIGTTSNLEGKFEIPFSTQSNLLIVSYIGFKTEKIVVDSQNEIEVILTPEAKEISNIEVTGNTPSTQIDYLGVENRTILTNKELLKAACCTLAESFETNPSVDVSFTDAITGVRQIEMLGLSGIYTQTTLEALPYIRGIISNVGLSFVPGTWIKEISVSKGVGSVANGFESITGQIDISLHKPFVFEEEQPLLLNVYGDNDGRYEGNINYRYKLNDKLSSITFLHASSRNHKADKNSDSFADMPSFQIFNFMQRWQYLSFEGWESQFGFQFVSDKKNGGTISSQAQKQIPYQFNSTNRLINVYGKTGYVNQVNTVNSFGLQWSYNLFDNSSQYGSTKNYSGREKNIYLNFIYQSNIFNELSTIRSGISFIYDEVRESFQNKNYDRIERVPGVFTEYTYKPNEDLSLVLGLRADKHNQFGYMVTPRLHLRYSPETDWVFKAAIGRGYRKPNIFTEYSSAFVSSRNVNILGSNNFGTGLEQESAWNYGINLTHYFLFDYRDATLSFDFYRTDFNKATIADLDSDPQRITFSSVSNGSYSNSFQVEFNLEPFLFFNSRFAYKYIDAKQFVNGQWLEKPFTANHRALINLAYKTAKEELDDQQMSYDLTLQWFGNKRIPSTASNPTGLRAREISPSFVLVNTQVTRSFSELFDLYIGIENLLDFRQNEPIIDPENPNGQYFDASLIWGPLTGRMVYAGLRYKI